MMKKYFFGGVFIALIFIFFQFSQKNNSFVQEKPILIAHAGGALNGKTYLNSKEALENSIQNGFQFIELDLLETTDMDIVAAHDWKLFHQLTENEESEVILSSEEAQRRKILGDQTVLTSKAIYEIFMSHPSLYLITDKIQNIDLLDEKFSDFKDRIIVEVFSIEKYKEVQSKGFLGAAFCVWRDASKYHLAEKNHVNMVTIDFRLNDISSQIQWLKKHPEIISFAFSSVDGFSNNKDEIKKLFPYVNGWYTDFLNPKMLEED